MIHDTKRTALAIVAKLHPEKTEPEEKETKGDPGFMAAIEDVMAALGQDYGSGPNAEKGQRQAFEDKRDRLARAFRAAIQCCGTDESTDTDE